MGNVGPLKFVVETVQCSFDPLESNVLLFESQILADSVISQIVEQCMLGVIEHRQIVQCLVTLLTPQRFVGHQRCPVHQQRFDLAEAVAQLIENGEAVGVDIAPIADAALGEPLGLRQRVPSVTGAEHGDCIG